MKRKNAPTIMQREIEEDALKILNILSMNVLIKKNAISKTDALWYTIKLSSFIILFATKLNFVNTTKKRIKNVIMGITAHSLIMMMKL